MLNNEKIKTKLAELEKTSKEFWNVAPEAANFLNILIKSSGLKNLVEVGTSNGYSAIWFAEAAKFTGGTLLGMDFYNERIELARENLTHCELIEYVTIKQGMAIDVLNEIDFTIDFAFIDANKSEYLQYFEIIDKKLRAGGIIAADNVTSHSKKVEDFMNSIQNHPNYQTQLINFNGGLLLAYKTH